jgi:DNA-binding MarR family transcriptional regulator
LIRELLMSGEGHRQMLRACASAGITPGMLKMALQLSADEPQPMGELARRLHCDASYVTSIVDGLEQAGFAERRPHPSDRRIKTVVLTDRGVEVMGEVDAVLAASPPAFEVLSVEEQEQLQHLLGRVVDAARLRADAEPTPDHEHLTTSAPAAG